MNHNIKDLTLGFFTMINSDISEDRGIYRIIIPQKYRNFFQESMISITFDTEISRKNNCELIIVGSKTLSLILDNCERKGPIALKKSNTNTGNVAIRYHFFMNFSGMTYGSELSHIDIDLDTLKPLRLDNTFKDANFKLDQIINPEKLTSSYMTAIDELKIRCKGMQSKFLDDANTLLQNDLDLFVGTHESKIRELDQTINHKETTSDDPQKISRFRFDTIDRIKELEKEKERLIEVLQEKHKVTLSYSLIACEVILY